MFEAKTMLYLYLETSLHAGIGRGLGAVDLPIQRERTTGYPTLHAGGIKGSIRSEAQKKMVGDEEKFFTIFGPETKNASDHAGAISFGDARLLLFPVRSLSGTFAWTTSLLTLASFDRIAAMIGHPTGWILPDTEGELSNDQVWVNSKTLITGDSVILDEFSFSPIENELAKSVGKWLADNALPKGKEYDYWRKQLQSKLCVLPENAFRDFALYSTEVQTHIKLDPDTKTVETGALWVSESLPTDSLMYLPILATDSRNKAVSLSAQQIIDTVSGLGLERMQMGGDETTGQGIVSLRFGGGK